MPRNRPSAGHNSGDDHSGTAAMRLRGFIDRIERLDAEKAELAEDIRTVYAEAGAQGFDSKAMRAVIRLRKMSKTERDEHEALIDIYKAGLGMLSDTPLGSAALRRLSGQKKPGDAPGDASASDGAQGALADPPDGAPADPAAPEWAGASIDQARRLGAAAAERGDDVITNPFPARDPRRAAWDEAWCMAAGSDGMEIPPAWRRQKPPKKSAGADDGAPA